MVGVSANRMTLELGGQRLRKKLIEIAYGFLLTTPLSPQGKRLETIGKSTNIFDRIPFYTILSLQDLSKHIKK